MFPGVKQVSYRYSRLTLEFIVIFYSFNSFLSVAPLKTAKRFITIVGYMSLKRVIYQLLNRERLLSFKKPSKELDILTFVLLKYVLKRFEHISKDMTAQRVCSE